MLACMLGESGDILFPKLEEEEMVYFRDITEDFFKVMGRQTDKCRSEEETKQKAGIMSQQDAYPVYYFSSDTSGEKLYEEFYTENDELDMTSFNGLGVVKNAKKEPLAKINRTLDELKQLMNSGDYDKADIVNLLKNYIPNFEHIETGKSLDQKM
jgi:hypothetical protein